MPYILKFFGPLLALCCRIRLFVVVLAVLAVINIQLMMVNRTQAKARKQASKGTSGAKRVHTQIGYSTHL